MKSFFTSICFLACLFALGSFAFAGAVATGNSSQSKGTYLYSCALPAPPEIFTVSGGGDFLCPFFGPFFVNLSGSEPGVRYLFYYDVPDVILAEVEGTGDPLDVQLIDSQNGTV